MSDLMPKGKETRSKPSAEIKTLPEGMKTPDEKQKGDELSGLGKVSGKMRPRKEKLIFPKKGFLKRLFLLKLCLKEKWNRRASNPRFC